MTAMDRSRDLRWGNF